MFSHVILKSKRRKIMDAINLYEPVKGKLHFADLKVSSLSYIILPFMLGCVYTYSQQTVSNGKKHNYL